jgi:regulator of sirC expression with transglutaminase-like and TPR domain
MARDGLFRGARPYFPPEKEGVLRAGKPLERRASPQSRSLTSVAMFKQREAIIRLLKDSDPETVDLTKRQLARGGSATIPDLRDLLSTDDKRVTQHVREILTEIELKYANDGFDRLCETIADLPDLEQASWYLAQIFQPDVDIEPYLRTVDAWGRTLRGRLSTCSSDMSRALTIGHYLGMELGLRGNEDDYFNARNSLLPCVIESRLGIPISLSVVYMIVARRAACVVDGVILHRHFVVRHGTVLLDPFNQGRILTASECEQILPRQNGTLHQDLLQSANPKLILYRMLANLLYIFQHEQDGSSYKMIMRWIHRLEQK